MAMAHAELVPHFPRVPGRKLAAAAHVSLREANAWLKQSARNFGTTPCSDCPEDADRERR